jgi:transcriptional regulator with XRE-family HTH domain
MSDFYIKGKRRLAKPFHYKAIGLDNVYLLNGVVVDETAYGAMVHIDNINGLHHAIGLHIVEKREPMIGAEFRFLRKQLQLTQEELAKIMRVTYPTIANYEKGETRLGPADALIRDLYLFKVLPDQTRMGSIKPMIDAPGKKLADVPRQRIVECWQEDEELEAA